MLSGLAEQLPALLHDKVYLGVSAGSAIVTQSINVDREVLEKTGVYYDDEYDESGVPNAASDKTLHLVNFTLRPHLNADYFPIATFENVANWAAKVDVPLYAFDDQTAIKVVDGDVQVISEGAWELFEKAIMLSRACLAMQRCDITPCARPHECTLSQRALQRRVGRLQRYRPLLPRRGR